MLHHANLVVTAWDEDLLVGIARTLSDFAYVGYLADLALIQKTREQMGSPLHVGAPVRAESGRLLSKDGLYPT